MTPIVLGIAGGTASGKTSLARRVSERLPGQCLLIVHDRYYRTMPDEWRDRPTEYNFDHPDALETSRLVADLDRLRSGEPVTLPDYDYITHSRKPEQELMQPMPIIVVEGILVFASAALRERFDHTVFVDAPSDIRLIRRIRRDAKERGRAPLQTIDQYMHTVRPMHEEFVEPGRHCADLIVDTVGHPSVPLEATLRLIGKG